MLSLSRVLGRLSVGCVLLLGALTAGATHFRGGILRGVTDSTTCATFTIEYTARRDGYSGSDPDGHPAVGDVVFEDIGVPLLIFGDGTSSPGLNMRVVAIDKILNSLTAFLELPGTTTPGRITKCYAAAGTYTVAIDTCCTISSDPLNPDSDYRLETILTVPSAQLCPIVSGTANVDVIQGTFLSFPIPAADPGGRTLSYRLATPAESRLLVPIPGLAVNSVTGFVTWAVPSNQAVGPYDVEFMVENGVCKIPYFLTISVVPPGSNLPPTFIPPSPCGSVVRKALLQPLTVVVSANDPNAGDVVRLNNLGLPAGATFAAGSGNPATGAMNWTPPSLGLNIVTFTATDGSFVTACSFTLDICAGPLAVVSGAGGSFCPGTPTTIQAALTGVGPWSVTWSDGVVQSVASSPAVRTVTPAASTTYTVSALADSLSCPGASSGSVTVNVLPPPSSTITAPATVCPGSAGNTASVPDAGAGATYAWTVTNGTITAGAGTRQISFTAGASGSVTPAVTVTGLNGCTSGANRVLPILPTPTAALTGPATACSGQQTSLTVNLTGQAPWTLRWSDGLVQSIQTSPATRAVAPAVDTTYSLTSLTDGNGCIGTVSGSVSLLVRQSPTAAVTGGSTVCSGGAATISAIVTSVGPFTAQWNDGFIQTGTGSTTLSRVVNPTRTFPFMINSISDGTCSSPGSGRALVVVGLDPNAAIISAPFNLCARAPGATASVPDSGAGASYTWSILNGTIDGGQGTRFISFTAGDEGQTRLAVTVRLNSGCQVSGVRDVTIDRTPPVPLVTGPAGAMTEESGLVASVPAVGSDVFAWTVENGSLTAGQGTNTIHFSAGVPGVMTLRVVQKTVNGCSSEPGVLVIPISGLSATRIVPVVVSVVGTGGAHFSSELTLSNPGGSNAHVELTLTPADALGGGAPVTVSQDLAPGRQLVIPDAVAFFGQQGAARAAMEALAAGGGLVRASFSNLPARAVVYAGTRTTALAGPGRAGLSYPALAPEELFNGRVAIYGLRETAAERTNLALENAGTSGPIGLRVTLVSGAGDTRFILPDNVFLQPGQWFQIGSVLKAAGYSSGWALVERVSGTDPFYAYGVANDNVTNDGAFLAPVSSTLARSAQVVPAIVETAAFGTELVLVNPGAAAATVTLNFVESLAKPGGNSTGFVTEALKPGEQRFIPNIVDYLRSRGASAGPKGPGYAGPLFVRFTAGGTAADGYVASRTSAPAPGGGVYGVSYPGVTLAESASSSAWVFGLQQNAANRSNFAMLNAASNLGPISLRYDVYDGLTGAKAGGASVQLYPGQWMQVNAILRNFGLVNGYVRVTRTAGTAPWVAYGIINDGTVPGAGTGDGSFISMTPGP